MSYLSRVLRTEVPAAPFRIANRVLVPLALMTMGCWRTWVTAQSPFEELVGVQLAIAVALLWAMYFGYVMPNSASARE